VASIGIVCEPESMLSCLTERIGVRQRCWYALTTSIGFTAMLLFVGGCASRSIAENLRAAASEVESGTGFQADWDGLNDRLAERTEALERKEPVFGDDQHEWPAEGPLSLDRILDAADHLNPRIAAARARVGAAGGRAWQASFYPNPWLGVESENVRPSNGGLGVSETTISISQPIIIAGRREAAVAVGASDVSAERWGLERVRREIHGHIRRVVTDIEYQREALRRYEQLRTLAERTVHVAEERFGARAAPESEAIRARVEYNSLALAIDRLQGEMAVSSERLETLLGGHAVALDRLGGDTEAGGLEELPPIDRLKEAVRSGHPAVLAAEARAESAERQVELERARRYPDITARLGAGVNHADDEGFVEAGLGIPLPILDQNKGNILAARFDVIHARQQAAAIANDLVGELSEAYRQWESATARLAVFEEQILSGARRAYDQASDGYQAGKLQFLDLLDAQRTLSEAQLSQLELRRAVRTALAEILAILGGPASLEQPHGEDQ
jgi:cobalt-zinc-cadmium efflux system outer membrane protein